MSTPTQLQLDITAAGLAQSTGRTPLCPHVWEARLEAVAAMARSGWERWKLQRRAADTRRALERLDARALRDLAVDRSEISSLAAEVAGRAEPTRTRVGPAPARAELP